MRIEGRRVDPVAIAAVTQSMEIVVEDHVARNPGAPAPDTGPSVESVISLDRPPDAMDHLAQAVLYNGLGHHEAARTAAERACAVEGFALLEWALAELVEACTRSHARDDAVRALGRLQDRALRGRSPQLLGLTAYCRALVDDSAAAGPHYREALDRLTDAQADAAVGRTELAYGGWLRRRGRPVEAKVHLTGAEELLHGLGMVDFAQRARRELLAAADIIDSCAAGGDDLTSREAEVARLARDGSTSAEIGRQLHLSPRTVEWHLRKVFAKLGIRSRRELHIVLPRTEIDLRPG